MRETACTSPTSSCTHTGGCVTPGSSDSHEAMMYYLRAFLWGWPDNFDVAMGWWGNPSTAGEWTANWSCSGLKDNEMFL